ncbi:MAG: aminotransferase class I/II-fold pyridoxal phosphate-dependent enzyme [Succinivibrio sp.]
MLKAQMESFLLEKQNNSQLRTVVPKKQNGSRIIVDGSEYINLSSNDYLGLGSDLELSRKFIETLPEDALRMTSSGSPLLTGAHESYQRAKDTIEGIFSKKALFFNSGFSANSGVIAALSTPATLILADKLSHASMIDGMMAGKGKYLRFAHNDYEHLEKLIKANEDKFDDILVVSEAIFSMDGDACDLKRLCDIKKRHEKVSLYIDEAHSFGLYGKDGSGLCVSSGLIADIDYVLTTFGKGIASQGACLLASDIAISYLINTSRSLIFSTALSPFAFEHVRFMIEHIKKRNDLRERLAAISSHIHSCLERNNFEKLSSSQIIPVLTGDNESALKACAFFRDRGLYVMPIRHPTVPKNQARLRISLTASLTDSEVEKLENTISEYSKHVS